MSALANVRLDLVRLAGSRRWMVVLAVWIAIVHLSRAQLAVRSQMMGLAANAWDLRLIAVNNWMYVSYLLLLAFVFLIGDSVASDRASGWAAACITRSWGVFHWWVGKFLFIFSAALVYHLGFLGFTLVGGTLTGLPIGASASALARGPLAPGALFAPFVAGSSLFARVGLSLTHESLGFAAIGMLVVALSARSRRPPTGMSLTFVFVVLDWVFAQRITLWELLSPGRRLLESVHLNVGGMTGGVSWASTFAYLFAIFVLAIVVGGTVARDLEY